jgi:hypothetical protein
MSKITTRDIETLAALNAEIAALNKKAEAIKTKLKEAGPGTYAGKSFKAVVSESLTSRLDTDLVRKLLGTAALALATKTSHTVRVSLYDL